MVDSRENYKFDLGVKGLKLIIVKRTLTKKIAIRSSISHSKYQKRKKNPYFQPLISINFKNLLKSK